MAQLRTHFRIVITILFSNFTEIRIGMWKKSNKGKAPLVFPLFSSSYLCSLCDLKKILTELKALDFYSQKYSPQPFPNVPEERHAVRRCERRSPD